MHRDGTRASRGCPRAARASLHLGGRACVAYTVRCAHLSLACRAGLCRCRAAESVKGAARVQDSRLESGSRGVCCERFDREHTPGPTCWAVNFCLLSVVAASAVALRGPARSGRRAPARGSLRTGALDRRGPTALGPQRDTSRAPLSRSALHSLHPRSHSPARVLGCAQHPFVVRHPQPVPSNSLVDACSAPHTAPRLRPSTTSPVSSLRRPDASCRLLAR